MRIKGARADDAMGELIWEANALAGFLREQRLGAMEATALLRKILAQIDVAMFGFDGDGRLQLVNDSGRRLLGRTDEEILGSRAEELGLAECLTGETPRVLDIALPGGSGRWELRRGRYREKGISHSLIFLSDLTHTLHEEERRAWKRLIRTVRHEVNNSLTPIQSVADSLRVLIGRKPLPGDWQEDLKGGLGVDRRAGRGPRPFHRGLLAADAPAAAELLAGGRRATAPQGRRPGNADGSLRGGRAGHPDSRRPRPARATADQRDLQRGRGEPAEPARRRRAGLHRLASRRRGGRNSHRRRRPGTGRRAWMSSCRSTRRRITAPASA